MLEKKTNLFLEHDQLVNALDQTQTDDEQIETAQEAEELIPKMNKLLEQEQEWGIKWDALRASLSQSVDIIQLDYGALDIIEPFRNVMEKALKTSQSEDIMVAYRMCVVVIIDYLNKLESELLTTPK